MTKRAFSFGLLLVVVFLLTAGVPTVFAIQTLNFNNGIINSSGYIGIGTSTPSDLFEIAKSATGQRVKFDTSIAGSGGILSFSRPDDSIYIMSVGGTASSSDDAGINAIGGGARLRLGATTEFDFDLNQSNALLFGNSRPTPIALIGTAGIITQQNGNVGLSLRRAGAADRADLFIGDGTNATVTGSSATTTADEAYFRFQNTTLHFQGGNPASTDYLTILSGGNVGIGTSSPAYTLDVVGTGRFAQPLIVGTPVSANQATTKNYVDSAVSAVNSSQWVTAGSGVYYNSGSVSIGTTTMGPILNISGISGNEVRLNSPAIGNSSWISFYTPAGRDGYWQGDAGGYMDLDFSGIGKLDLSGGNVGIGTTTPAFALDVNGTGRFTQPLIVGTPVSANQAATKSYVDSAVSAATSSEWIVNGNNLYNANSGFIGIGTNAPQAALHIANGGILRLSDYNGSGQSDATIQNYSTGSANDVFRIGENVVSANIGGDAATYLSTGPAAYIDLAGNGDIGLTAAASGASGTLLNSGYYDLTIATSGNVGIGTFAVGSPPSQTLEVHGNTSSSGLCLGGSCVSTWFGVGATVGATGNNSVGYGAGELSGNTGVYNSALGFQALQLNTTGYDNTGIGTSAMQNNTTGTFNTAVGVDALEGEHTGTSNVAIGLDTLYNSGGSYNTAVGATAMLNDFGGVGNVALGADSGVLYGSSLTNAIAIGYNAVVGASNSLMLGGTGTYAVKVGIGTSLPSQTLEVEGNASATQFCLGTPCISTWGGVGGTGFNVGIGTGALLGNTGNLNTAYGYDTLHSSSTGGSNTALGEDALFTNTAGSFNTAVGIQALADNTTGNANTAVGLGALIANSTGTYNTAVGVNTLESNTTGNYNTALGSGALAANTTGTSNTAVGYQALLSNFTGTSNVANGYQALYSNGGSNNVAIGPQALYSNVTGNANLAVGSYALYSDTGGFNVAVGGNSLYYNTTGNFNTAVGLNALYNNVGGSDNVAVGEGALTSNNNGPGNVAVGEAALSLNTSGNDNTANGLYTLEFNKTGNQNVAMGQSAGVGSLTNQASYVDSNSVFIGAYASRSNSVPTSTALSNAIAIGSAATVGASNTMALGGTGANAVNVTIGSTTAAYPLDVVGNIRTSQCLLYNNSSLGTCSSDERIKKDVSPFTLGLNAVLGLKPVNFYYNGLGGNPDDGIQQIGFIAQDVAAVAPELVGTRMVKLHPDDATDTQIDTVNYSAITYMLVNAVQSQQKEIVDLQKPSCLEVGNSDGSAGINYITVLHGVLTATTTMPSNCQ